MPLAGYEPAMPPFKRSYNYASDRTAIEIGRFEAYRALIPRDAEYVSGHPNICAATERVGGGGGTIRTSSDRCQG